QLGLLQPTGTGGAPNFMAFIQTELQPMLASSYPVDARRQVLLGHSLGGLFVLHTLLKQPDAFFAYVASSASVWWADRYLEKMALQSTNRFLEPGKLPGVWMTVGEYEQ